MTNNINVRIDTSSPYLLDVEDNGGQNQVSQSPQPTTISWHLTGELTQGNFVSMSDPAPGFEWVGKSAPKENLFGPASVSANGNTLSIQDFHTDASSNGSWVYILRVSYQGHVYSTTYTALGPGGTVNDPVIINR
jgi:hypothetical protein